MVQARLLCEDTKDQLEERIYRSNVVEKKKTPSRLFMRAYYCPKVQFVQVTQPVIFVAGKYFCAEGVDKMSMS